MKRLGLFLSVPVIAVALLLAVAPPESAQREASSASGAPFDQIDNIIVIVEQNHTFDSYFGTYPGANGLQSVTEFPLQPETQAQVEPIPYSDSVRARLLTLASPGEEVLSNARPTAIEAYNGGAMDGFVKAQVSRGLDGGLPMVYYQGQDVPGLWDIADQFVLFDNYYSSALGDSLPNMLHLIAGTSAGITHGTKDELSRLAGENLPTLFDQLQEAGVSWKYYIGGLETLDKQQVLQGEYLRPESPTPPQVYWAPVLTMHRFWTDPQLSAGVVPQGQFFLDAAKGQLPSVSFMLPSPTDHPISPPAFAHQRLLGLVNAVAKSPQWQRSAIFIVWDEWGGFYDHVSPPQVDELGFGFRVPALLVSPWATRGYVSHVQHDHTSILNFVAERFDLPPLSERQRTTNGFEDAFQLYGSPREAPAFSLASVPPPPVATPAQNRLTLAMYATALGLAAIVGLGLLVQYRRIRL